MEHIDKKALNKELLLWLGFTCVEGIWSYPDGITVDNGVPFFPEFFDECIEWLVPKLQIKTPGTAMVYVRSITFKYTNGLVCCLIEMSNYSIFTDDRFHKSLALAFCLAVKKIKGVNK